MQGVKIRLFYEDVHGEGNWFEFIGEYWDVVVTTEDELPFLMPEMSIGCLGFVLIFIRKSRYSASSESER